MLDPITDEKRADIITACRQCPDFFIDEWLGLLGTDMEPYENQRAVIRDLAVNDRVALVAANGTGKSFLLALACLWFGASFSPSRVVSTAGTWEQVESKLWMGNVHKLYNRSRWPIGGRLNSLDLTLRDPATNEVTAYVCARSTKLAEYFEGHHEDYILIVFDEAKSIPQSIFDAADRCRSSGKVVKMLVASTPGADAGPFFDLIDAGAKYGWKIHTIDAFQSPRIRRDWIEEMRHKHGEQSDFYRSAVLAQFPISKDDEVVITRRMLELAAARFVPNAEGTGAEGTVTIHGHGCRGMVPVPGGRDVGVDIADSGDNYTRIVERIGGHVTSARGYQGHDTMYSADRIVEIIKSGVDPHRVRIDFVGIGKGTYDRLRQLGYPVTGVNFGWRASTKGKPREQQFANLGAELWWLVRRKLLGEPGAGAPIVLAPGIEKEIRADCVGRKWRRKEDGSIALETKEQMAERGLPSPDYADALCLSFAPVRTIAPVKFPACVPGPSRVFHSGVSRVFSGAGVPHT